MKRAITEDDLRIPEFRGVPIADLERREDGTIARRDRWERGIREIASLVGLDPRQPFEVSDVVTEVRRLTADREHLLEELRRQTPPKGAPCVA